METHEPTKNPQLNKESELSVSTLPVQESS